MFFRLDSITYLELRSAVAEAIWETVAVGYTPQSYMPSLATWDRPT